MVVPRNMKLKVVGEREEGVIYVDGSNLMQVMRKGQAVGHVVVDYLS